MATTDHRPPTDTRRHDQKPHAKDNMAPAARRSGARVELPAQELLARYAAGERVPALALRYGCSEPTVRAHLRRLGALPAARQRRTPPIERAALEELYTKRGWPVIRIAAHFGVCPATIDARRRTLGIPARRPRRREGARP